MSRIPLSRLPWAAALSAAALAAIGLLAIGRGDELAGVSPDAVGFAAKQRVWAAFAAVACGAVAAVPTRLLKSLALPSFAAAVGLLILVYAFPARNGSQRWIPVGPVLLQPSEFAKLAVLLALARYLSHRRNHRTVVGLIPPFLLTVVPVGLILKEPDLGTALVFLPMLGAVLIASGARGSHLAAAAVLGLACLPVLWLGMSAEQRSRVTAVFTQRPLTELSEPAPPGDGYHLHRSKQVLALGGAGGSAGLFGGGSDLEERDALQLPAARTDFVFCLVAERFGLPGTLAVLGLFGTLVASCLRVAARCGDPFGRLTAAGVGALFGTQAVINTAMTVGLMPITGLALPLVSYGGSSLVACGAAVGLVIGVALRGRVEVRPDPLHFGPRFDR
ncbi:FtsW/RodA/SpoVE family cell cycle protein [Alienimonas californiensis]|uniref:Probable peptidoglycan glycosyltransferase FtsW n=1 Tax=Alienimonas californiensis TaxID=2527989 RepID=A0A517PCL6_9PLAN|nr:FtsW/RodA/SpoVE family cell cycle protein [Alienimonas californiensis]QDT17124.1 Peptidoglycan glycosyltransferase MrdB [Alienimonas californiensis]